MTASTLVGAVRRRLLLLLTCVVLGAGVGAGWALTTADHTAGVTMLVEPGSETQRAEKIAEPERFIRTQIRVLLGTAVLTDASRTIEGQPSVDDLRSHLEVDGGAVDDTIALEATGSTAQEAEQRVVAVATSFSESTGGATSTIARSEPRTSLAPTRAAVAGGVLGLLAGLTLAVLLANVSDRVHGRDSMDRVPAEVYPGRISLGGRRGDEAGDADVAQFAGWLRRRHGTANNIAVVAVGDSLGTRLLVPRLARALEAVGHQVELVPAGVGPDEHLRWWREPGSVPKIAGVEAADDHHAAVLASFADHVVLVARDGATRVSAVEDAARRLGSSDRVTVVVAR